LHLPFLFLLIPVDATGASWYASVRFLCFTSLTVHVEVEVIFNVSYLCAAVSSNCLKP